MGIDINGGMIVGNQVSGFEVPEEYVDPDSPYDYEWWEYLEDKDMKRMSPYYDADIEDCYFGFKVADVPVSEMDEKWLSKIRELADSFEEITGEKAELIGCQDVY